MIELCKKSNKKESNDDLKNLQEKCKKYIRDLQIKEYNDLLEGEAEVKIYIIKLEDISEDVSRMAILEKLIQEN